MTVRIVHFIRCTIKTSIGTIFDYVQDTLEPMLASYLLKTQNYFYQLVSSFAPICHELTSVTKALSGRYTPQCCPVYLTASGFQALKANRHGELDAFRLYTSSITQYALYLAFAQSHILFAACCVLWIRIR